MPTGYTADVQSGKVTDFADFAMNCARAFGALVSMRDKPSGTPIPDKFEPNDYHARQLVTAKAELSRLLGMSLEQVSEEAEAAHAEDLLSWERRERQRGEARKHYEAMLEKAKAWTPPTAEHDGLKKFMIKQLTESISFDTMSTFDRKPEKQDPGEWHKGMVEYARRNVDYHANGQREEDQRARENTAWVRALRDSLKAPVLP